MLLEGFGFRLLPLEHPLLLARPAEFTESDCTYVGGTLARLQRRFIPSSDVMRTLVGVPYVAFVDQAVCTLAALDRSSGLVLSINRYGQELRLTTDSLQALGCCHRCVECASCFASLPAADVETSTR